MDSSPNVTELPLTKPIQPNTNELPPKEIAKRAGISLGRGFAVGFTGKALLSLLSVLQTLRKKQKSKKILQSSFSGAFKYGCFVGNLTGVSTLLLLLSHRFRKEFEQIRWLRNVYTYRGVVAGGLAGLSLKFVPREDRVMIMLTAFVRALEVMAKWGYLKGYVPYVPFAEVWLMMVASAQVIHCWIFQPQCLSKSYLKFLDHHGGRGRPVVQAAADYHSFHPMNLKELNEVMRRRCFEEIDPTSKRLCCDFIHGQENCFYANLKYAVEEFFRAIKVYIPVFLIPLLLFNYKRVQYAPTKSMLFATKGILRSSFFLSMYCTQCWVFVCVARHLWNWRGIFMGAGAGASGGAAVIYEQKSRRIELALYVFMFAIHSFYNLHFYPHFGRLKHAEVLLFMLSTGAVLQAFICREDILRNTYVRVIRYFIDNEHTRTKHQHVLRSDG